MQHPLLPDCALDYWRTPAGCEAAQQAVAEAVEELLHALPAELDTERVWMPRFWRMGLGSFLWALLSHVFDRIADPPASTAASLPLSAADIVFSSRDFALRLPTEESLRAWVDRAIADVDTARVLDCVTAACTGLCIDRPGARKKTPESLAHPLSRLRRLFLFWEGDGEIVHFAAPFSHAEARGLALRSRGRIRRLPCPEQPSRLRYDGTGRADLARRLHMALAAASPLARVAAAPAAALLPTAFVEQRDELREWAATQRLPRVLASALGFERSPYFVALADRACAAGAQLIGMQHGGFYGQTDPTWSERIENQISDRFCTWGYRHRPQHWPMPSVRLGQLRTPPLPARTFARRALWAYSGCVAGSTVLAQLPHYRRERELNSVFIAAVRAAQASSPFELALRPYPRLGRDLMVDDWRSELPQVAIEPARGRTLLAHASEYDLTIFNFPGATGFLEFLHADRPAIIFCPPEFCPLRREARAAFQPLIDAGLYAVDIEGFQRIVAAWCDQGIAWWRAPVRVAAREAFRREYGQVSDHAVAQWARFLQDCAAPPPVTAQA